MLITFEGIDGAGKSTQIKKLASHLRHKGREVLTLREPGGTEVAEKIRQILLESRSDITPVGELLLFSASRAELVAEVVRPALEQGQTVILDRFFDSTTAYQGYGRGLDIEMLRTVISISTGALSPDITFYLDILPEESLIRKFSEKSLPLAFESEELDRMERSGLEFYRKVREGYRKLIEAEPERFVRINARLKVQEIHQEIVRSLRERFDEGS
ncbi:dTMP kinase [Chlorobium sp. N1]|uniref:dTMP kinase n=1 Tax=Chlorobium sp. N1 TaxID=2491138 RepID=UPI001039541D|nr:dTMP kinase [Chlorobium sp. N1]TCD48481.1 dTMP kinase [Chlorobium sp. N1]